MELQKKTKIKKNYQRKNNHKKRGLEHIGKQLDDDIVRKSSILKIILNKTNRNLKKNDKI
jgi:hypothetical protein